jgi:hypothetical protein
VKYDQKHAPVVAKVKKLAATFKVLPQTPEQCQEMEPEAGIVFTARNYSCDTGMGGCGQATGWRDITWGVDVPCCSEECRAAMDRCCAEVLAGG